MTEVPESEAEEIYEDIYVAVGSTARGYISCIYGVFSDEAAAIEEAKRGVQSSAKSRTIYGVTLGGRKLIPQVYETSLNGKGFGVLCWP